MNIAEITTRLYAIGAAILEKTGETPFIAPAVKIADGECTVDLMKAYTFGNRDYIIGTAKGDTPEAALDNADMIIATLPSIETAKLHQHMARVADCIDKAHADGIAAEYVNPLRLTVKAMSDNLLAAPVPS
jgi:hypothetical protein